MSNNMISDSGNLYHWHSNPKDVGLQIHLPWGNFFDIKSLQQYISVIEMYKFMEGISIVSFQYNLIYL